MDIKVLELNMKDNYAKQESKMRSETDRLRYEYEDVNQKIEAELRISGYATGKGNELINESNRQYKYFCNRTSQIQNEWNQFKDRHFLELERQRKIMEDKILELDIERQSLERKM